MIIPARKKYPHFERRERRCELLCLFSKRALRGGTAQRFDPNQHLPRGLPTWKPARQPHYFKRYAEAENSWQLLTEKPIMAEMPNHEVGDAVFVREEQQEMPYPAKVHSLHANQTYVKIAKDENNDIKLVPHCKVIPQKKGMYVLVTSDKGTDSATIVSFDEATEQYKLNNQQTKET